MKKVVNILSITGFMFFGAIQSTFAQEAATDQTFHQILKQRFIEGGPSFMGIVLVALILGLAIAIERIIYLNMATTNTKKLVASVDDALSSGGVEAAKEVCRNTKGPVASIFYQGLDRADEGIEAAEKAVIGYGGVQMGLLREKRFLVIIIYRSSTDVRVHGNCNWYDCIFRLDCCCKRYLSSGSSRWY